jgi:hypothetical protein
MQVLGRDNLLAIEPPIQFLEVVLIPAGPILPRRASSRRLAMSSS